uniref:Uncharacterized protein n=1 Tax=Vannella robusta TaxID=1487602 RepID=A0A7S4I253_9EUKA|mmetsp:Transcript_19193/g.24241  ORF Transcript_19193/g.24241 Transcript_19193/m.24241 type:complete len:330 (+) Transcript_19193:289-1278(+)|eukprot:CAMPEP_0206201530 /NCGR_PEP_ID=MMETSP0166-20121206/11616_1 /ASSEMBLY_ACC=CAM_ASM_000260 /TAXON_ID=95228 /ORGANISM="Vannella robusta, Strain DIVA3 518/3/11/1/6" /LENGTH=329 /DNA_ID=CAMNT_0053620249 /DNA_START=235 /DNA_END=1224 /DNA_ORIENTATION=-
MCHLTERLPKPPVLLDPNSIRKEEPISVAPATEALSFICALPQKRKFLSNASAPASKLHKPNNEERTILDAARSGNLTALQRIIASDDCDINKPEPVLGNTALHLAVSNNHLPFVQILLQSEAINVDPVNRNGATPLLSAIDHGHSALVRMLISAGANAKQADKQGFTALHKAVLTGNMEILRFLVKTLESDSSALNAASAEQRLTPLHQAAFHGKKNAMKVLLCAGAAVSPLSFNGTTPLHMASLKNHPKAMSLLLEHGASPDAQDNHKRTPLHYACLFGHLDAASVLCGAKCNVSVQDFKTKTPLALAACSGLEDLLQLLVSHVTKK